MDVKTRAALSGNSTLAILLILIMLMVTFFLVATPFMLGAVLNTQNHFNKLEKAFLIAEYSQLTDKVEYSKWIEGNLSESYDLFFSLPLIELLPKAYPKVNQDIHKLKNLLLEYIHLKKDQNQSSA